MLERLHDVDWSAVTHAYGAATDVPDLIHCLTSPDADVRDGALHALFGNIFHQGTVYPATAVAIPFLYEVLAAPGVLDKPILAALIAACANGVGYLEVHAVGDAPFERSMLAEVGKTLEEELTREKMEIAEVRAAVSTRLELLLPFLADSSFEVRELVASCLGNYPEHAASSLAALRRLESDPNEAVRAVVRQSVTRLTAAGGTASRAC